MKERHGSDHGIKQGTRTLAAIAMAALLLMTASTCSRGGKDAGIFAAFPGAKAEAGVGLEIQTCESKEEEVLDISRLTQDRNSSQDGEEREEMLEVDQVRLCVKEAGTGRDMILIHGRTLSKECMDPLFEYYRARYHVVSYDVRGHGKTESSGEFTLDDLSDDLVALIDAYQLKDPVVIGFSMGSYIALRTAERHPDLFPGMVLIGTRGGRTSSPWPATDAVGRALESYDNMTDAPKVTVPVLVLTGEYDAINPPEEGKKVADALPNAVYQVVPGAEHMAFAGNPDFVFAQVDEYLKRLNAQ